MYAVKAIASTQTVASYEAAVKSAKSVFAASAENIRSNTRLFRSPKVRSRLAAAALKVAFPKKSGDVSRNVAGIVRVDILKA